MSYPFRPGAPSRRPSRFRRVVGACLAVFGLGCGGGPSEAPSFRIGVLALYGGNFTELSGRPTVQALRLYADSVNGAGGVDVGGTRHRVELIVAEHTAQVEEVTTAARRLINLERVDALIGPQLSSHAVPVGGIAHRAGVPMISPMSSNRATTEGRDWVFRMATPDEVQAKVIAEVATRLEARRAGVLLDRTSGYSVALANAFEEGFAKLGGEVVREEFGGPEVSDYRPQLRHLRAEAVDALYIPTLSSSTEVILEQVAEVGLTARLLGGDGWSLTAVARSPVGEGALATTNWHFDIDDPANRGFMARYAERWGEMPRSTAALTRDALDALVRAAEFGGSIEEAPLRDALVRQPSFNGASGVVDFAEDGTDRGQRVVVSIVEDGEPRLLRTVDRDGAID